MAHLTGHQGSVFSLAQWRTPQYILSGAGDGWIVEWDLDNPHAGKLLAKADSNIFSLCAIPEKKLIVAGNMNGGFHFIHIGNSDKNKDIQHHKKGIYHIGIIEDQLLTLGGDGILTRWDIDKQQTIESIQLSSKSLRCMDFSEKRQEFIVGASDGHIYILDKKFTVKRVIKNAHKSSVFTVKYIQNSPYFISGGRDALLKLWKNDTDTNDSILEIAAHLYTINSIVFHPNNSQLFATGSRDKTIKVWNIDMKDSEVSKHNKPEIQLMKVVNTVKYGCHINSVNALFWSSYHNWLISGSDDRSLIVWEIGSNDNSFNNY